MVFIFESTQSSCRDQGLTVTELTSLFPQAGKVLGGTGGPGNGHKYLCPTPALWQGQHGTLALLMLSLLFALAAV